MLRMEELKKSYPGFSLQASLAVEPGRIVGLIGANGAGKTTIFKAALGLIHADGGRLRLLGRELADIGARDRERIGTVLADAGFSDLLSVGDVKTIMQSMYGSFDAAFFEEKIRASGIEEDRAVRELSTGRRARLKAILALSHHPDLLLLDEPTAGLDVVAREEVYDMVRRFMEEDGRHAVLISSHISADLEKLCDEFYMIDRGAIILHETADALFEEYAVLKMTEESFAQLDKTYVLKSCRAPFGYTCLTDQRAFYQENAPHLAIEKAGLDELITLMIRGE